MRKIAVIFLVIVFGASVAFADNTALTYSGYDEGTSAEIHIYAYMAGLAYSLSNTAVYFDGAGDAGLTSNEFDHEQELSWSGGEGAIVLQNDGGVRADFSFWVSNDDALSWNLTTSAAAPGANLFSLYLAVSSYSTASASSADYTSAAYPGEMLNRTAAEATTARFDHSTTAVDADANGLKLYAFDPDYTHRDGCTLFFAYWAPSSADTPGTTGAPHNTTVEVDGKLADD